jgi:predicted SprT family Zn-dependent metalloprotease
MTDAAIVRTVHPCKDCEQVWGRYRQATVYLPEGRYLCGECWAGLKTLRESVVSGRLVTPPSEGK